jgi:hypothetical protein
LPLDYIMHFFLISKAFAFPDSVPLVRRLKCLGE